MSAITGMHTTTTNAVEVPEVWSDLVLEFQRANLVMANLVERRDVDVTHFGDIIHMPVTAEASATAYTNGMRLTDNLSANTDTEKTITINKRYFSALHVQWDVKKQSKYDIKAERMSAAGYAIAKQIDNDVSALADSLTTEIINDPAATGQTDAISLPDIINARRVLNNGDVPMTDRQWVFSPDGEAQLYNISGNYFISYDFRSGRPLENGMLGSIMGDPVYKTTAIDTRTEGSPAETVDNSLYFHKQAFGLAMQTAPEVVSEDENTDTMGYLGAVRTLYGVGVLRPDFGVRIATGQGAVS